MANQIHVKAVTVNPDGTDAPLVTDLKALPKWMWGRIRKELEKMSSGELLSYCEPLPLRDDDGEGSWVSIRIPPVILVCQIDTSAPALFKVGAGKGTLKIIRALPEDRVAEIIEQDLAGVPDDGGED